MQYELFSEFRPEETVEAAVPSAPVRDLKAPEIFGMGYTAKGFWDEIENNPKIRRVVDVRTSPWSRIAEFSRGAFPGNVRSRGKEHAHLPALGGKGSPPKDLMDKAYAEIKEGDVLVCMEADPRSCHRFTKLQPVLEGMGFRVTQLLDPKKK
jgi:uncharacterized protein (DUF488 family)